MKTRLSMWVTAATAISSVALAQEPVAEAVKEPVKPALLTMVKEGVFELQHGKSIDVTDRKILLSFPKQNQYYSAEKGTFQEGRFMIFINGDDQHAGGGQRFDLKKINSTAEFVKDTDVCMLDVVELIEAKGTVARAVMRINCQ